MPGSTKTGVPDALRTDVLRAGVAVVSLVGVLCELLKLVSCVCGSGLRRACAAEASLTGDLEAALECKCTLWLALIGTGGLPSAGVLEDALT